MKPDDQNLSDLVRILRKRSRAAATASFVVLVIMTCVVFALPAVYESSASLLIEELDMQVELAGGEGTQEYVEQRLQRTRQRVLTDENVQALINRHKLYDSDGGAPSEEQLAEFHENVFITPQVTGVIDPRSMRAAELTYAFDVGFWHSDPVIAQKVANDLAGLFIASSAAQAKEDAQRAIEFAQTESERLAAELRLREARLTGFRQQNPGGLPEDRVRIQDRALTYERELAAVDADLRAARARRELYEAQLRDTPRDAPVLTETGQVVLRGADRLAAAQQELVAALAKYSEDHPDVRRLRREIATLTVEVSSGESTGPTNPEYMQLQTQVNAAGVEVRELSARRGAVSSALSRMEGEVTLSPKLEEQYRELVRDYEVMKTQYEQMRAQQATAELRSKAAGASAAENYVLINPARLPEDPIEPDRVALMFLAIVLAIAAGLGTAFLLNATDSTIRGGWDVAAISGTQPFGHVPTMLSTMEQRRRHLANLALGAGMVTTIVLVVLYAII